MAEFYTERRAVGNSRALAEATLRVEKSDRLLAVRLSAQIATDGAVSTPRNAILALILSHLALSGVAAIAA